MAIRPKGSTPLLSGRLLPALSSIIVTRPLTAAEQAAQGWTRPALIADSRKLLFYIRLLRDGRLLFGARGGTRRIARGLRQPQGLDGAPAGREVPGLARRRRSTTPGGAWCASRATCCPIWAGSTRPAPPSVPGPITAAAWPSPPCSAVPRPRGSPGASPTRRCPTFVLDAPPRFPVPGLRLQALRAAYLGYGVQDEWL